MGGEIKVSPNHENYVQSEDERGEYRFMEIIDRICALPWGIVNKQELFNISHVYYYFSIQFRENLEIARALYPEDQKLYTLYREECETDNLSPWPLIAKINEKLNHDEFMRRLLLLQSDMRSPHLDKLGLLYLSGIRSIDQFSRAKSITSYEDNGLSKVFSCILQAPEWHSPALQGFRFFLEKHIEFDSDSVTGHGSLSRHLHVDDTIVPLWGAFYDLLLSAAPSLSGSVSCTTSAASRLAKWFSPHGGSRGLLNFRLVVTED
jgi:hypothetical protein